jgi:DNA-binding transcriptional ArsR family regulator
MFKALDPLLHSELRLAIMSLLMGVKEAEFGFLKEKTKATSGNLSVQLQKLSDAGYIEIRKSFKGKYPVTSCTISNHGVKAFEQYVESLKSYFTINNTTK